MGSGVINGKVNGFKIMPDVTAIIQARMGSKRLPGKSMKEICGKPMLAHIIERAKAIGGVQRVVVATTENENNQEIIELAEFMGANVFVGSEQNVLERYYLAAREYGGEYIVRITGDNPFTDVAYGTMAVEIAVESMSDLSSVSNIPLGTGVEVIKRDALDMAYDMSETAYHFEHVTPYIKEHPELFSVQRYPIAIENPFPNLRLTVDTDDDFDLATRLYEALYRDPYFSTEEVIAFLKKNPSLVEINSSVVQRAMTHSENGR